MRCPIEKLSNSEGFLWKAFPWTVKEIGELLVQHRHVTIFLLDGCGRRDRLNFLVFCTSHLSHPNSPTLTRPGSYTLVVLVACDINGIIYPLVNADLLGREVREAESWFLLADPYVVRYFMCNILQNYLVLEVLDEMREILLKVLFHTGSTAGLEGST